MEDNLDEKEDWNNFHIRRAIGVDEFGELIHWNISQERLYQQFKSRLLQELSEAGYLLIPGDCKATYQEKED